MAHKVKVNIPYIDWDGNRGSLRFDAEVETDCLSTVDGCFTGHFLEGIQVDCMPDIRMREDTDIASKIQKFRIELEKLQSLSEKNYQESCEYPNSDFRLVNNSAYLAAVKDIMNKFINIFKED